VHEPFAELALLLLIAADHAAQMITDALDSPEKTA